MYRSGLKSILSELLRQNRMMICDDLKVAEPKTKAFKEKLTQLGIDEGLVLVEEFDENIFLSARNLRSIVLKDIRSVNPVDLVNTTKVIMTTAAVKALEGSLS
jgi:large subunit ribosomal protein L4